MNHAAQMYTNVTPFGDDILFSGYDADGKRYRNRESFQPILYEEYSGPAATQYTDLYNRIKLKEIQFNSMTEARNYKQSSPSKLYGMDNFALQYISSHFPPESITDFANVHVGIIDIEVYTAKTKIDDMTMVKWSEHQTGTIGANVSPLNLVKTLSRVGTIYVYEPDARKWVLFQDSIFSITISTGFPDVSKAINEINAITLYSSRDNIYYVYGFKCDWSKYTSELDSDITDRICYTECDNEAQLCEQFINKWVELDLDIITGWNSELFDIPYIYNRMIKVLSLYAIRKLSPWGIVRIKNGRDKFGNTAQYINIIGINQIDYIDLFTKYTFKPHANYKLGTIATDELGHEKIDYSEAKTLHNLFDIDPVKFIDYNVKDVIIVRDIDDKHNLIELIKDIAYFSGINFDDTFSPVKIWDTIIYRHLAKTNKIPQLLQNKEKEQFPGAYVKSPIHTDKLFKWVVSFDLASEYPSVIRQWNIGPDTYAGQISNDLILDDDTIDKLFVNEGFTDHQSLIDRNVSIAGNGTCYDISKQSFLSELMEWLYEERNNEKTKKFEYKQAGAKHNAGSDEYNKFHRLAARAHTRQLALKVLLNSAYGALGNKYFRFYDIKYASAVTTSGRVAIKWIANDINKFLVNDIKLPDKDRIIAIDTDSVYVDLEDLVNQHFSQDEQKDEQKICDWLDRFSQKFTKTIINDSYERLKTSMNCREQLMIMDREVIASSALWRAKKNYAMRVLDLEGVRETTYKILGLETQRGGTPSVVKEGLLEVIYAILQLRSNDDVIGVIEDFKTKYKTFTNDEVSISKSCNNLDKYYENRRNYPIWTKGTPGHVKAALVYNREIEINNLENEFELIKNGDYIKILELSDPNPFNTSQIAYTDYFPPELKLAQKFVDRSAQFKKSFFNPATTICAAAGLKSKRVANLMGMFK